MSDICSTLHTAISSSRSSLALSDEYYETSSERLSPRGTSSDPNLVQPSNNGTSLRSVRSDSLENEGVLRCIYVDQDSISGDDDGSGLVLQSTSSDSNLSQTNVSSHFGAQLLASLRMMGLFASDAPLEGNADDEDEDIATPRPDTVQALMHAENAISDELPSTCNIVDDRHNNHQNSSPEDEVDNHPSSVSEAKRLILENLAQLSRGELFSRQFQSTPAPKLPQIPPDHRIANHPIISPIGTPVSDSGYKPKINRTGSLSSRKRLESLLRIDLELQPLNLRLSRLLAEFRAEFYGQLSRRESCCPRLLAVAANSRRKLAARACRSCGDYNDSQFLVSASRPPKRRLWNGPSLSTHASINLKHIDNTSSLTDELSRSAKVNLNDEHEYEQRKQLGIGAAAATERIESARSGFLMSGRSWRTLVPRSELVN
ncbi:hypothetical protein QAD02_010493 [Eretmocerus hayati]|uniref:Uncharacterized protein n=1 Tax=Eretmocerus hayati TaxID=131215 RepID=A0ACC2NU84_9HYME|nr:hypothetical protein QAD02_010493 [Eretmocerus hayati]